MISIVGDLPSFDAPEQQDIVEREGGSWLVDGSVIIERLKSALDIRDDLPGEEENGFNTLGGFVMHMLGRIPVVADYFDCNGLRFEVMDMDKNRVDKILVAHLAKESAVKESADKESTVKESAVKESAVAGRALTHNKD